MAHMHVCVCACQSHSQGVATGKMAPTVGCTEELVMSPFNVID